MSWKYKVQDSSTATFITCTIVDWVDLFIRRRYCQIIDESLNYCILNKGLKVHAYVYMTSHIHLIVSSETNELQDVIRDFKKYTSVKVIEAIKEIPESRREWLLAKFRFAAKRVKKGVNYKVWKDGFHPVMLDNGSKIMQRLHYMHQNPVEIGFVFEEGHWINSSYKIYETENPLPSNVKVDKLF